MRSGSRGHNLAALRRLNTSVVLRALHRRSPQTLSQLAAATGLSRPTVELLVEELTAQGWTAEAAETTAEASARAPGRPAKHFRFRGEAGQALGIDIGLHKIVLLLSDLSGTVLATEHDSIDPELSGAARLSLLRTRTERFLEANSVRHEALWATCVGVPGMVDSAGRITSVVVPEWTGIDLARRLGEDLPGVILVENDVNLAVLAEHWRGAAVLADDVVCVLTGRRVSSSVMLDGRLHRGHRGGAGEMGMLPLLGLGGAQDALTWPGERHDGESEVDALARAAADRNPAALDAIRAFAGRLTPGVAALVLAVDPELLVLTGGAAPLGEHLVPMLAAQLREVTLHVPRIAVSTLGEQGVALGAVRKALDRADAELLDGTTRVPQPSNTP
jgi:predicted NBD/HSP70 family sugar kinase